MKASKGNHGWGAAVALAGAIGVLASCSSMYPTADKLQQLTLSGSNEVPPVVTTASGTATVTIGEDRSVKASVTVTGMPATASHIHEAAAGANGPVIVPLAKTGENEF